MPAITFDTLKFANKLKEAGVPDKQTEAQAFTMAEAFAVNLENLATKDQVEQLGTNLIKEIQQFRAETNGELRHSRQEAENNKKELLQIIEHNDTRQNGRIQLLQWMFNALLATCVALFVRLMFFRIN